MENDKSKLADMVAALRFKVDDQFSGLAIGGALRALADIENPLRLNFFSTGMRILFEHLIDTLSPEAEVARTSWFKPERDDGKPSRGQRVLFAIQGGFSDAFLKEKLNVDVSPLRKRLTAAFAELSKHVHGGEATIIRGRAEQDVVAERTTVSMGVFLDALRECREAVLKPVTDALDDAAVNTLLSDEMLEVDELATHFSVDELYVDSIIVSAIGADKITYKVTGSVEVTLQWGSNSDVRRGDSADSAQSFPFHCEFQLPLDDPWDLDEAELTYGVDVSGWHDMMAPDDDEPA
jgi:hypothetical protein